MRARSLSTSGFRAKPLAARMLQAGSVEIGLDLNFDAALIGLPPAWSAISVTYTRNSPKVVHQNGQLITLSANQFGTTFDSVTGKFAFDPEPAATNLEVSSEGNVASATGSNVSDGSMNGFDAAIAYGDNSVQRSLYRSLSVTAQRYSWSTYIQMDDGNAPVVGTNNTSGDFCIVVAGVIGTANVLVQRVGATGSLYRVSAANPANATAGARDFGIVKYTGQSARGFKIAGRQAETGMRATSYIKTSGGTASRSADVMQCALAGVTGFNAASYTLFSDFRLDGQSASDRDMLSISDNTASNRAVTRVDSGGQYRTVVVSGGTQQSLVFEGSAGIARAKLALSCSQDAFLRAVNGASGTPDMAGAMPVSPTHLDIGLTGGIRHLNGFLYAARLIPTALSQEQVAGLTSS